MEVIIVRLFCYSDTAVNIPGLIDVAYVNLGNITLVITLELVYTRRALMAIMTGG